MTSITRKLVAILAADVVGYSRLMGVDEEGTLARLKAHRRGLIDPRVSEHHGRVVKTTGDGMLVEFASVVDAVKCAVQIQRAMPEREAHLSADRVIQFRIGVNLGDVMADRDDIHGDGVNVAARLETLAEPGGVCIARSVHEQIRDKLPYAWEDLGDRQVKNIARPLQAFQLGAARIAALPAAPTHRTHAGSRWWIGISACVVAFALVTAVAGTWWARGPQHATAAKATAEAPHRSIVVLPFLNVSSDPEQEYLADAFTDDLTTDLSRIAGSFVIAQSTAFTFKGRPTDVKEIGRQLGVRYVLEGSLQRADAKVTVNVRLVDAETGAQIWTHRVAGDRRDFLGMQNEITAGIAGALGREMVKADARRIQRQKSLSTSALDHIALGQALSLTKRTAETLEKVRRHYEAALEQEPQALGALTGLGFTLMDEVTWGYAGGTEVSNRLARAEQLFGQALALDPGNAVVYAGTGRLRRLQDRLDDALAATQQALSINPNLLPALTEYSLVLFLTGRPEDAIDAGARYLRINPLGPTASIHWIMGTANIQLGRLDDAISALGQAQRLDGSAFWIHSSMAAALALQGRLDEAKRSLAEYLRLMPHLDTLKKLRAFPGNSHPRFRALADGTVYRGLLMAGLPEE